MRSTANVRTGSPPPAPADRPSSTDFIKVQGPLIVIATVILPTIIAAVIGHWQRSGRFAGEGGAPAARPNPLDHAYRALIEPLGELAGRLGWAAILVFGIILTYRLTDSVGGPFALPFYLQELKYSNDEVAFASKFFGVGMTMAGMVPKSSMMKISTITDTMATPGNGNSGRRGRTALLLFSIRHDDQPTQYSSRDEHPSAAHPPAPALSAGASVMYPMPP